jgi:hypothetical protein
MNEPADEPQQPTRQKNADDIGAEGRCRQRHCQAETLNPAPTARHPHLIATDAPNGDEYRRVHMRGAAFAIKQLRETLNEELDQ